MEFAKTLAMREGGMREESEMEAAVGAEEGERMAAESSGAMVCSMIIEYVEDHWQMRDIGGLVSLEPRMAGGGRKLTICGTLPPDRKFQTTRVSKRQSVVS